MDDICSDFEEIPENLHIQPYMFEPPVRSNRNVNTQESSEESEDEISNDEKIDRRRNTIWCECGICEVMKTRTECICCDEIPVIDELRGSSDLECITQHRTFIDNCLNARVLEVSLYGFIQREGPLDDNETINETYRPIAYRRFVLWIWHRLGWRNRKVLPACVVTTIRRTFPSEDYTGFQSHCIEP
ncbi:P2X purinoceptor 7-like [Ostrea edulis]|uniref:P2X purinoceptor 7-like n=1 Tax=Ostrea edulis TaxID=37623 RepID=UPI0024AFA6E9|nr:P2X purinoceptor 7-like [Ostrea edulis]